MIQLIITDPAGEQKKQIVNDGSYTIGRSLLSDFRLPDKSLGRKQLELTVCKGDCAIEGGRLNDTFRFNGIETQKIDQLIEDDVIEFGESRIQILRHAINRVTGHVPEIRGSFKERQSDKSESGPQAELESPNSISSVSYTHLTLPTICSV